MSYDSIKSLFTSALDGVVSNIHKFTVSPAHFSRSRKIPPHKLITFLVSQGSSSTRNEIPDFFGMDSSAPSASAFNQQRAKLSSDALKDLFDRFNSSIASLHLSHRYDFIAADGSSFTFQSSPQFVPECYSVSGGHSTKGFFSMHLNAFFDLQRHIYTNALIQPVHDKDEFRAFCTMVDHYNAPASRKAVFIGDRGYASYNNMAHVLHKGHFFLFRTKDIHSRGLVSGFHFPDSDSFDVNVKVTLVRSRSKKLQPAEGYKRYIDSDTSFDYVEYGSMNTYELTLRIVRFPLSDSSYECIITNLPDDEFPPERIKRIYFSRWGIESSFRKLKYTIGLSNFHARKPEYIKQEIWARLTAYNLTECLINETIPVKNETRYEYKVNFTVAAHICRVFLRPAANEHPIDIGFLLQRERIPIRTGRQYPRLKTAHFRKPRHFIYRPA